MNNIPTIIRCAGSVLLLGASSLSVQAALLAYEGFDYSAGTLDQGSGGTDFTTNWSGASNLGASNSNVDVTTGSLTFPTGVLYSTVGNKADDPSGDAGFRGIPSLAMNVDEDYFVSFLWRRPTVDNFAGLSFYAGSGEQIYFGSNSDNDSFRIAQLGGNANGLAGSQLANTTYFVVGKIQANATGFDQAFLKAYVEGDTVEASETMSWTVTGDTSENLNGALDRIRIDAGDAYMIDEIRIGETWEDVVSAVPEPTGSTLLAIGAALGLIRRRR